MSVAIMALVFTGSRSKGASRLVLLALADEASDRGELTAYRRSRSHIASKCNCTTATVRRAVEDLVKLGELEIVKVGSGRQSSDYQIVVDQLRGDIRDTPQPEVEGLHPAPPRGDIRDTPGVTSLPPRGDTVVTPIIPLSPSIPGLALVAPAPQKPSDLVARSVWENKTPRPAIPFPAVRQIAGKLLDAGWAPDDVISAMIAAPTISIRSVEFTLNQRKPKTATIDTDRSGPAGRVKDGW